jgi:hypothetical protein
MASTSSRSSARIRDRDKAVRGTGHGRNTANAEDPERSSRTPRYSNQFKPEPQPIIVNFNGDVQITKGTMFGRPPDKDLQRPWMPSPALRASNGYGEAALQIQRYNPRNTAEDEEVEAEFEGFGNYSYEDEPSQPPPLPSSAIPTAEQRVRTWQNSGYSGNTRESQREKHEVYRASLSRGSQDGLLADESSSRRKEKTKPLSVESTVEDGGSRDDNEIHLGTQGDDGGDNGDDSDDVSYITHVYQLSGS